MRSLDGPGSYTGSGVDVEITEIYYSCEDAYNGSECYFDGYVESYDGWVECPRCGVQVFLP